MVSPGEYGKQQAHHPKKGITEADIGGLIG